MQAEALTFQLNRVCNMQHAFDHVVTRTNDNPVPFVASRHSRQQVTVELGRKPDKTRYLWRAGEGRRNLFHSPFSSSRFVEHLSSVMGVKDSPDARKDTETWEDALFHFHPAYLYFYLSVARVFRKLVPEQALQQA